MTPTPQERSSRASEDAAVRALSQALRVSFRVLKWILDRVVGSAHGVESPLGWVPTYDELNLEGLDFSKEDYYAIVNIDREVARQEANDQEDLFTQFGDHLPRVMELEREQLIFRLYHSPKVWDLSTVSHPHD